MSSAPAAASPAPSFTAPAGYLPPLFLSHGAPLLLLAPGAVGQAWHDLAQRLPRPRAILVVSAHWLMPGPTLGYSPQPETIHDFYGFPDALYDIRYPASGAADLTTELRALVPEIAIDSQRGLDHGAWVPLHLMYPAADIPVTQLAVMAKATPQAHLELGRRLAPLTTQGVLILASGGLTHNLRDLQHDAAAAPQPYAAEFADWFAAALARQDQPALCDYRRQAPHAARAHPSEEHLLPLFVALGAAAAGSTARTIHRGYDYGALAMDAYEFS